MNFMTWKKTRANSMTNMKAIQRLGQCKPRWIISCSRWISLIYKRDRWLINLQNSQSSQKSKSKGNQYPREFCQVFIEECNADRKRENTRHNQNSQHLAFALLLADLQVDKAVIL